MGKISLENIDNGQNFDFGATSENYGKYRDIYPKSLYNLLKFIGVVSKGKNILDIGTGSGVIPRNLYDTGASFYGIDISEEQIKVAKLLSEKMDIQYKVGTAENIPYPENYFDTIIACQCFWYFDENIFLNELKRVGKIGSSFVKISMEWLPYESEIIAKTEKAVLKFNPVWNGCKFLVNDYKLPVWAKNNLSLSFMYRYKEEIPFSLESWVGRMLTCRGIGATLSQEKVAEFKKYLTDVLKENYGEYFHLPHFVEVEVFNGI